MQALQGQMELQDLIQDTDIKNWFVTRADQNPMVKIAVNLVRLFFMQPKFSDLMRAISIFTMDKTNITQPFTDQTYGDVKKNTSPKNGSFFFPFFCPDMVGMFEDVHPVESEVSWVMHRWFSVL